MTSPQTLVPEIRFEGFSSAWEQRKLGDIGSVAMCRRIFKHQTSESGEIPFFKIGTFGGEPDAFITRELFEEFKAKYPYPDKGDILISASGSIGRTVEFTGENEYFQDSNIVWLKHDKSVINPFLRHLYSVVEWAGIEGSTIKRLYNDNILKTEVMLPSVQEQTKIAEMLDGIDSLITLHQRKYDRLKNVKKSMLEKMFPRDGANVPEIRFAGFNDAWEQRKFSDFALRESSIRLSSSEYPSVEYEDVVAEEGRLNKDVRLKETQKTGIVFEGSQVLYGKLRPYLHNWLNPDFTGVAVGDWWVLRPIGMNKKFLYRLIQTQRFDDVANQSSGSKMPRADWNLVSNTEFIIPSSLDEQRQIAEIFDSLDNLITLHQRKCDKLRELKNSLLQKMFV